MGCATTGRISLIIYNILLAFIGIGVLLYISFHPDSFHQELVRYILCAFIVLFALIGLFAAIRENLCAISVCAVFLLILALLQVGIMYYDTIVRGTQSAIATVDHAWDENEMDTLQIKHECCGKDSAQDYVLLSRQIPDSCYLNQNMSESKGLFIYGCNVKLEQHYHLEENRLVCTSWLLIIFEILGFLLSVCFVITISKSRSRFLPVPT